MAIRATFLADFSTFQTAVEKAELSLKSFETGGAKVEKQLNSMANSFSGQKVLKEASLMASAIEKMGGVSGLTQTELKRVVATMDEAIAKSKAMGADVPAGIAKIGAEAKAAQPMFGGMGSAITGVAGALGIAFTGTAILNGIKNQVSAAVDYADTLSNLSARLKVSVGFLQDVEAIGTPAGVSMESMAKAAKLLAQNLDSPKAVGSLQSMGLSFEQIRAMKPEDQFLTIARSLADIEDPIARANAGAALFGRGWDEVAGAFEGDIDSILANTTKMTDQQVAALDKAGDAWDEFTTNTGRRIKSWLGEAVIQFGTFEKIVQSVFNPSKWKDLQQSFLNIPELPKINLPKPQELQAVALSMDEVNDVIKDMDKSLEKANKPLNDQQAALDRIHKALVPLTPKQQDMVRQWRDSGVAVSDMAKALGISDVSIQRYIGQLDTMKKDVPVVNAAVADFSKLADPSRVQAWAAELERSAIALGIMREKVTNLRDARLEDFGAAVDEIPPKLSRVQETAIEVFDSVSRSIANNFAAAIVNGNSFKDAFSNIWQSIRYEALRVLSDILESFVKKFLSGMLNSMLTSQGGFTKAFSSMFSGLGGVMSGLTKFFSSSLMGWIGIAAGVLGAVWGGVKKLFGGGTIGTVVNPARDQWFGGRGVQDIGDELSKFGIDGNQAATMIKAVFDAKSMDELQRTTGAIDKILQGGAGMVPEFATGTGGRYLDFGPGTLAMLHGKEKITPLGSEDNSGRPIAVTVMLDGREIAWALVPHLPDAQAALA